jgi:hypothetical protein
VKSSTERDKNLLLSNVVFFFDPRIYFYGSGRRLQIRRWHINCHVGVTSWRHGIADKDSRRQKMPRHGNQQKTEAWSDGQQVDAVWDKVH